MRIWKEGLYHPPGQPFEPPFRGRIKTEPLLYDRYLLVIDDAKGARVSDWWLTLDPGETLADAELAAELMALGTQRRLTEPDLTPTL